MGLGVGAAAVGYGTSLGDLVVQGALCGLAVGGAQGFVLRRLREGDGLVVDHINRDKLDNRKANLRVVAPAINILNSQRYEDRDELCERSRDLRSAGWLNADIAAELGVSIASVSRWCAGIPRAPHPSIKWTKEAIAGAIQTFVSEHGRLPTGRDLNGKNGMPGFVSVYRRFSSLPEAREFAGFESVDLRSRRKVAT